jgi:hypothetical protein
MADTEAEKVRKTTLQRVLGCMAADTHPGAQPTQRRDALFAMQAAAQKKWADCRVFEAEAPPAGAWTLRQPHEGLCANGCSCRPTG